MMVTVRQVKKYKMLAEQEEWSVNQQTQVM